MDTVVWQLLASVACPGYTIHTVVALMHAALLPIEVRTRRFFLLGSGHVIARYQHTWTAPIRAGAVLPAEDMNFLPGSSAWGF